MRADAELLDGVEERLIQNQPLTVFLRLLLLLADGRFRYLSVVREMIWSVHRLTLLLEQ